VPEGESSLLLKSLAKELNVVVVGGSIPECDDDGKLYNTSVTFDEAGTLLNKFRKIHLFGASNLSCLPSNAVDNNSEQTSTFPVALRSSNRRHYPQAALLPRSTRNLADSVWAFVMIYGSLCWLN
jgi:predicted amidohydrolase